MSVPTLDDVLSFEPTAGGSGNDYVPDGWWRLGLVEISMPFQEASFNNPDEQVTKVRFYFEIAGTYNPTTGEPEDSEYNGSRVSLKVKADANGPKSTKYIIASALVGQDLATYAQSNGAPKPSDLIGLACWGKVENKQGKKDPNKWYTELKWDSFNSQLPSILLRPAPPARPQAQGRPPARPNTPAQAQAQPAQAGQPIF